MTDNPTLAPSDPTVTTPPGGLRGLATWSFRHRWIVLASWLVALVALLAWHSQAGSRTSDQLTLPGTDSYQAQQLLQSNAPREAGDQDVIVIATHHGKVTDPAVRIRITPMLQQVAALAHVVSVSSPYAAGNAGQIAPAGQIAFATVTFDASADALPTAAVQNVISTAEHASDQDVNVQLGGAAVEQAQEGGLGGVGVGILAALIVLMFVFGSVLAALTPMITAAFALGVGIALTGLLSHVLSLASFSSELSLLIGLGVGIDYALFIVSRYRRERLRGAAPEAAVAAAVNTSGRAVLFAGSTVCIALLGLIALRISLLYGVAIAAAIVVACTVAAALTLLPALLSLFGGRILTRRQRRAIADGRFVSDDESKAWRRWAEAVRRRPVLTATAGFAVMIVLALPVLGMRLGNADAGTDPSSSTTRQAYDLLADGFGPGFNGPLELVAPVDTPVGTAAFDRVLEDVAHTPGVVAATPADVLNGHAATALVYPAYSPQDARTAELVHHLRDTVIPDAARGQVKVLVGGPTAANIDFAHVLADKLPVFIGIVILLSVLLLVVVFRSIVIPLVAAVMNLLSVGAGLGVVTLVFQHGWADGLIGVSSTSPIESFLPVMVFAILFGLSMDYEVFLISRIDEEWRRAGDNAAAVTHGLAATGRTITAAATIMVLVFAAFTLSDQHAIKLFGVGLASSVLLDALVVRSLLVPALMYRFGARNWYLPRRLARALPVLDVEG